ncbi:MAG: DUF2752 domain-containing protein [Candidatus Aminicenantes bacterium]|nr:DUF2752 domain-containing protein [Candidatus Aminicenantes bacterium]
MEKVSYRSHLLGHVIVFSVCAGILSGALFLSPVHAEGDHLSIGSMPVPDMCIFKNLTGIPCPGCGLSRAIVAAAHGRIRESLFHHRLGLLTLAYILLQFLYRSARIAAPVLTFRFSGAEKYLNRGIAVLGALYMLNWFYTLF